MLEPQTVKATGTFVQVEAKAWVFKGALASPTIRISYEGRAYDVSAHAFTAHPCYREAAHTTLTYLVLGCGLGFATWLSGLLLLRGAVARRRARALRDRVIAGTFVTTEKRLAKLTVAEADAGALPSQRCRSPRAWKPGTWR